jgi:hypothetical protein
MPRRIRLTPLLLAALLALSAPSIAQRGDDDQGLRLPAWNLPLRAEKIVIDADQDYVLLRGSIDWSNGTTTTSVAVICSWRGGSFAVQDLELKTDDRWRADPDVCRQIARQVQQRK